MWLLSFSTLILIGNGSLALAQANFIASTNAEASAVTNISTVAIRETNTPALYQHLKDEIRDYEQHPEHWQGTNSIEVAIAYITAETNFDAAIGVYRKLLKELPNNARAIHGLGVCYLLTGQYNEAEIQFKKGWSLGDHSSLLDLAFLYGVSLDRWQDVKPLVPDLLKIREQLTDKTDEHELLNILIIYSGDKRANPTGDKETFLKAIDGLSDEFILERKDTAELVIRDLAAFGYKERADKLYTKYLQRQN